MDNNEDLVDLSDAKEKQIFHSKCPSCGAEMTYSPSDNMLKCDFCGTTKSVDLNQKAQELDFDEIFVNQQTWDNETYVCQCKNCGVKEVIHVNDIAKTCSFCGTPNVVKVEELAGLKPNGVIPFKITQEEAFNAVKKWGKKKFYAASAFKKSINPEGIRGVYDPAFTFDTDTFTRYSGTLGKYYYTTKRVNGKTVTTRKIRYFDISGTYTSFFDDILIEASKNITQKYLDNLSPFDTNNSNEYNESFLLGFTANQYSKDGKECWHEARTIIDKRLKSLILKEYTYDVVASFSASTNCTDTTYKYLLLPIYVGHCSYHNKNYNFFVNGKTGKVTGKTPISIIKVTITVIIILAIIAVLLLIYQNS